MALRLHMVCCWLALSLQMVMLGATVAESQSEASLTSQEFQALTKPECRSLRSNPSASWCNANCFMPGTEKIAHPACLSSSGPHQSCDCEEKATPEPTAATPEPTAALTAKPTSGTYTTGASPTGSCLTGFYKDQKCDYCNRHCVKCSDKTHCGGHSDTVTSNEEGNGCVCTCASGYSGSKCEVTEEGEVPPADGMCSGTGRFWTCSVGDAADPDTYGQVCTSSGGPMLGSKGQEWCMDRCARGQTGQTTDCPRGDCMCAQMSDGKLESVNPVKMPVWECLPGRACSDVWCANNALQADGRESYAKSAGCSIKNGGAIGDWTRLNSNLCGGDPDLWTQYMKDNRDQASLGGHVNSAINENCDMK